MKIAADVKFVKIGIQRASSAKHFGSKKHLENVRQDDIIIPEWLFKEAQEPIKKNNEKVYNLQLLKTNSQR